MKTSKTISNIIGIMTFTLMMLLATSTISFAGGHTTYLCIGESGTGVNYNIDTKAFGAAIFDVSKRKFIYKIADGTGTVKQFGKADAWLPCEAKLCRRVDDAWGGHFAMRNGTNDFTAVYGQRLDSNKSIEQLVTIRGICSEI